MPDRGKRRRRAGVSLQRAAVLIAAVPILALTTLSACSGSNDAPELSFDTPTREGATAERTQTQEPTSGPGEPAAEWLTCEERGALESQLVMGVEQAMEDYQGEWGFAFIDTQCDTLSTVRPEHRQYSASSGKIVSVIAVLRAVADGRVELGRIEPLLERIMSESLDAESFLIEEFVEASELDQVLADAGASDASAMNGSWNQAFMTAPDLARVWAGLIRGELLDDDRTQYLLNLAGTADIPDLYVTFPGGDFQLDGFQYGQKAGYYVSDGVPYYLVGAGFLMPDDGSPGFAFTWLAVSTNPDLDDPQRREVFPLVVEHVLALRGG